MGEVTLATNVCWPWGVWGRGLWAGLEVTFETCRVARIVSGDWVAGLLAAGGVTGAAVDATGSVSHEKRCGNSGRSTEAVDTVLTHW